ncbi:hypothetical protein [Nocardioides albus]|uniref:Uncharacterized protein n=1 Tax=Nocardioides albus TaxID=1841 RepID=A0A7W5A3T6_9ACTN|nr:hypothetical protein [Nocardioides albus]MBB3089182.1 hypothetical protein [Nocardioides albus]GGU13721.1 hypothetical protein GCM10007979_10040 [Nocardioides albus]
MSESETPTSDELVQARARLRETQRDHARTLYGEHLTSYAETPGFASRLEEEIEACMGPVGEVFGAGLSGDLEEDAFWLAVDSMLFQAEKPKMSLAQRYLKFQRNLPDQARDLLDRWVESQTGMRFFEVTHSDGPSGSLVELGTGKAYASVFPRYGRWDESGLRRGDYVAARLLPVGDEWMPTTTLHAFPKEERSEILAIAEELAANIRGE